MHSGILNKNDLWFHISYRYLTIKEAIMYAKNSKKTFLGNWTHFVITILKEKFVNAIIHIV